MVDGAMIGRSALWLSLAKATIWPGRGKVLTEPRPVQTPAPPHLLGEKPLLQVLRTISPSPRSCFDGLEAMLLCAAVTLAPYYLQLFSIHQDSRVLSHRRPIDININININISIILYCIVLYCTIVLLFYFMCRSDGLHQPRPQISNRLTN
jgi:hypothetical protein